MRKLSFSEGKDVASRRALASPVPETGAGQKQGSRVAENETHQTGSFFVPVHRYAGPVSFLGFTAALTNGKTPGFWNFL